MMRRMDTGGQLDVFYDKKCRLDECQKRAH